MKVGKKITRRECYKQMGFNRLIVAAYVGNSNLVRKLHISATPKKKYTSPSLLPIPNWQWFCSTIRTSKGKPRCQASEYGKQCTNATKAQKKYCASHSSTREKTVRGIQKYKPLLAKWNERKNNVLLCVALWMPSGRISFSEQTKNSAQTKPYRPNSSLVRLAWLGS